MAQRRTTKAKQPRASWKGRLIIDLVQFKIEAFNAVSPDEGEIHFHQLHAACHSRIRYQKVCPIHGEVDNDEIVLGYEYGRNKYVEVDSDEIDAMRTERDKALRLDTFVAADAFDPMWFDGRTYYLLPTDTEDHEPYALIHAALLDMGRYGIGEMVFSQREQLTAVRATEEGLVLSMLRYGNAFREASEFAPPKLKVTGKKVAMAKMLIDAATEKKFDLARYADEYQTRLAEFVEAKIKGKDVKAAPEEEEPEPVINLMDALKRSLDHNKRSSVSSKTASKKRATGRRKRAS
jgi:DNA end-binding protein Ku